MLEHFSRIKNIPNKIEEMYVRGSLVIGMSKPGIEKENEKESKIEFVYDYDEEKILKFDFN